MSQWAKLHFERATVAVFGVLLLVSTGWSVWAHRELKRIKATPVAVHCTKAVYAPVAWAEAGSEFAPWKSPASQSSGAEWRYELFTPPTVFFNQSTGRFVVTPPPADEKNTSAVFALELVGVRRELYPLQLKGFFGEPRKYTATLTRSGKPGTLLAREGTRLEELDLTLIKFDCRRVLVGESDPLVLEKVAFVELRDERTGKVVTLNSREPKYADETIASIKLSSSSKDVREVRVGDVVSFGKLVYRIDRINYAPAELLVTCEEPGTSRGETKILRLPGGEAPAAAFPSVEIALPFPRLATGFVTPEK